jgi:MFS family permease
MPTEDRPAEQLYDGNFALAMASQMCFVIANTLTVHYARWIEFLGGDTELVGWIMGAGAVLGLILRPWMGQWINRLGARAMWLTGYAVFAAGSLGNLLLGDLHPLIYLLRSCLVLGAAIVFASSLTYISQSSPPRRRTEAIGILGAGGFLGMLIGPALGDLILSADVRAHEDFVLLFLCAGFANIVPAILLCFVRVPAVRGRDMEVRLVDFFHTVWRHWPGTILLVDLAFGICMTGPFIFLADYVDELPLKIEGVSMVGLFFWCYAGWGVTVRVTLRRVPERRGRRKVLLVGMTFMSIGMMCYSLVAADRPWMIVVPALLTGTAHALLFHTMTSLTIESFPTEVRGTGSALALMMMDLGMIAGAPILGMIASAHGFAAMFATIGAFCFVAGIVYAATSIPVWQQRSRARRAVEPIEEPLAAHAVSDEIR